MYSNLNHDTICSVITGYNPSAVAVIRISGIDAIKICNRIFNKNISNAKTHTIHFGNIMEGNDIIDEVLISIFHNTKSFTGEETVEISCHGSLFIQNKIINLLIDNGARPASPGEFSFRAFRNGKIDLSQAESIADLINSENANSHKCAINHLKGGFKNELELLRNDLISFASLSELELDFAEEDVEFANKNEFLDVLEKIKNKIESLIASFKMGNAIKDGIPVVILGLPNVGKSTLLNTLINEEKAIVSKIPGTTRDSIEDTIIINDCKFRFIDTAGIRISEDEIEKIGIEKSFEKASLCDIILFVIDNTDEIEKQILEYNKIKNSYSKPILLVINKTDLNPNLDIKLNHISISAKNKIGISKLKQQLILMTSSSQINNDQIIITNSRHYEELNNSLVEVKEIINGLKNSLSKDLLSVNIKKCLIHLGSITGEITTDDLLENIFSRFCIGK
ncbi:MAG: tRNA uridine-5-carboxymethylaminomethyl(34) synthesis GTPase MnmE [Flavobacteriales bacterium]|nr:tRNA uridine-5-carboxymethylaminomethyl(34) synthesis GTPase MnmE [Flavobacteriales bacterium]MBE51203.1 tRNA uridine-5-carboxymethylaminomethyl(34) synthesis GTPase MnmE [Flavobacteriales bacterium]